MDRDRQEDDTLQEPTRSGSPGGDRVEEAGGGDAGGILDSPTDTWGSASEGEGAGIPGAFGRFRLVRLLGAGGMGSVYEAFDPHLRRRVAVKVLQRAGPTAVERFLREARVQAGLDHPSICPIHEVGETDGTPYIVMRLIEGETLARASAAMTLEQKLLVVAEAASAVHEAHRAGLVHRDLKPGNIMVEEQPDGPPRVFVLDFGLARAAGAGDLTTDGTFLGTAAYASPEQVRGDQPALDRRTDVYSLGATLYSLVSGSPPFTGSTSSVLVDVLNTAPARLRTLGVPRDVETIILKCLEKEPVRRYPTARALAEDLRRFLDGEPITARPVGPTARALMWVRKNRLVAGIAAVAFILVLTAVAWGGYTRWRAGVREQVVRDLSAQVEGLEAEVRYSQMAPLHDIGPDRERLRGRMATISAQIEELGPIALGPGHYALGRAHLALADLDAARHHLEQAWEAGARDGRVALALGLTLSRQYRQGLAEAQSIPDAELRARRRTGLEVRYRQPAVAFMTRGLGVTEEDDPLLRALIAFQEGDLDGALEQLEAPHVPWLHEVGLLRGEILTERAQQHADAGRSDEAQLDFAAALVAFADAERIAQSDPRPYLAAGHVAYLQMLTTELSEGGGLEHLPAGLEQADAAGTVMPDDPRVHLLRARLVHRRAESLRLRHEDPSADLEQALAAATRAAEVSSDPSPAWLLVGLIHASRAEWAAGQGAVARRGALDDVLQALDRVHPEERGYRYYNALGIAHAGRGDLAATAGDDAREEYERAAAAFLEAASRHTDPHHAQVNRYQCLMKLAKQPGVDDAVASLRDAAASLEGALATADPTKSVTLCYHLGRCRLLIAQRGDPMTDHLDAADADAALRAYRQGREANPELPHFFSAIGEVHFLRGRQAWDWGRDPEPHFAEAEREYAAGIEVNPEFPYLHLNRAWLSYFRGKYLVRAGRDPGGFLEQAIAQAKVAQELRPSATATLCLGSTHRLLAEREAIRERDPSDHLRRARESFASLLADNPNHPTAHRALGRTWTHEARWLASSGGDPAPTFAEAERAMRLALEIEPGAPSVCLAEARRCLREAAWRRGKDEEVRELVARGIEHTDRALEARPGLPEALAIRAHLALVDRLGADAADSARRALLEALTANPHLEPEWGVGDDPLSVSTGSG